MRADWSEGDHCNGVKLDLDLPAWRIEKAQAVAEADEYCQSMGREILVLNSTRNDVAFGKTPAADADFKCLPKDLQRRGTHFRLRIDWPCDYRQPYRAEIARKPHLGQGSS
jgi:hypothetical protein